MGVSMNVFEQLMAHNAWANHTVVAAFGEAPGLPESADYTGEPLTERVNHMLEVERAFLDVLRGRPERPKAPSDLGALVGYADETGEALRLASGALSAEGLEEPLYVPWWEQAMPRRVLLSQVLAHSGQHRAELAWELAKAGVDTGELDFIVWEAGGRPAPGEKPVFPDEE
jgi:uncharacterized damage-inducible protein DinB